MGRYLERAENAARLVAVNANLLMDLPAGLSLGWRPLLEITGSTAEFDARHRQPTERNVAHFLCGDATSSASIAHAVGHARENARTARNTMPRIAFEYVNDLYLHVRGELAGQPSRSRRGIALEGVTRRVQQIEGFLSSAMMHDEKWRFLRIGNHLERADMTTRIIDARARHLPASGAPGAFEQVKWRSVLQSLYGMQGYLTSIQGPMERPAVLQFLFKNEAFPRSFAGCLQSLQFGLRHLPRNKAPSRVCKAVSGRLEKTDVQQLEGESLHAFINACQVDLGALHGAIDSTYFHFEPAASAKREKGAAPLPPPADEARPSGP